jgi:hypothetical protein
MTTSFLDHFDEDHPEFDRVVDFAQQAIATPFTGMDEAVDALSDLNSGITELDDVPEVSAQTVKSMRKAAEKIHDCVDSMIFSTFEKCMEMAAQCYPTIDPPFDDWLEHGQRYNNNIPYSGRTFQVVLAKYPLDTLLPVLTDYFNPTRYKGHKLEDHVSVLLEWARGEISNSKSIDGNVEAKAAAWLFVLNERVLPAHDYERVQEHPRLPALFFKYTSVSEHYLPFAFQRWPTFSDSQLNQVKSVFEQTIRYGSSSDKHARLLKWAELPWHTWERDFGPSVTQAKQALSAVAANSLPEEFQPIFQRAFLRHTLLDDSKKKQANLAL